MGTNDAKMETALAVAAPPDASMMVVKEELTPMGLLEKAVTSGADVEVLERLMALSERWQENQAQRAFVEALSAARGDLPAIVKTKTVDFTSKGGRTNYRYEDLADVIEQISPVLSRHGLSFRWRTDSETPGFVKVTCILSHRDGHSEETALSGPYDTSGNKNAIQAVGSVVTYLQRYTLKASMGIAAGADDDGRQGAPTQGRDTSQQTPQAPPQQQNSPTERQQEVFGLLMAWAEQAGEITKAEYTEAMKWAKDVATKGKMGAQIDRWRKRQAEAATEADASSTDEAEAEAVGASQDPGPQDAEDTQQGGAYEARADASSTGPVGQDKPVNPARLARLSLAIDTQKLFTTNDIIFHLEDNYNVQSPPGSDLKIALGKLTDGEAEEMLAWLKAKTEG